ncbi:MAG TPA: hypothetical protein VIM10_15965 [Actinopolymorphaceae bacterium]|jgi:hypothetical protein
MEINNRMQTSPAYGRGFSGRVVESARLSLTGASARQRISLVPAVGGFTGDSSAPFGVVRFSEPYS